MPLPLARLSRAAAVIVLVSGACTAVSGLAEAQAATSPVRPVRANLSGSATCGGSAIYKADGTPWQCSFDDEFSAASLDTTQWSAIDSGTTGYTSGIDCYAPRQVTLNGSELVLTANRLFRPTPCLGTSITSQYLTGMISTRDLFSQAYGRFEMRARFPSGSGLHPAFWMIPQSPSSSGSYEYGEIDIAEAYGSYPNYVSPHLHYVVTPGSAQSGTTCYVRNTKFVDHTYAVEWTPTQMKFLYDGTTCWTTTWDPAYPYAPMNASAPTPFDQPFYMMVQLAVDGPSVPFDSVSATTLMPAKMFVDYVRAWQ